MEFRRRLVQHDLDRRLVERTVELARKTGEFGPKQLRIALDSAPLWGAGRVEDTFNLIGHALGIVVDCAAASLGRRASWVQEQAGLELVSESSLKAALDIDWDDPEQQHAALQRLLGEVEALRHWVRENLDDDALSGPMGEALTLLAQVVEQDLEPDPNGSGKRIRRGVARSRRISISDGEMRHGRKSRSRVINGFKRHIAIDMDTGLILAAAVLPANEPEHRATVPLRADIEPHADIVELAIDRGYLAEFLGRRAE